MIIIWPGVLVTSGDVDLDLDCLVVCCINHLIVFSEFVERCCFYQNFRTDILFGFQRLKIWDKSSGVCR